MGLEENDGIPRSGAHRPGFCLCPPRWPRLQAKVGMYPLEQEIPLFHPKPFPKACRGCKAASHCQMHRQGWASRKTSPENGTDAGKHPTPPNPIPCLLAYPRRPQKCEMEGGAGQALLGPSVLRCPSQETCSTPWLECLTEGVLFSQGLWGSVPLSHAQPILHHNAMLYLLHWHHWHLETVFHGSRIDFF